jgi:hypothetical protein
MTAERQKPANLRNAQLSTAPKTPEGHARSGRNAADCVSGSIPNAPLHRCVTAVPPKSNTAAAPENTVCEQTWENLGQPALYPMHFQTSGRSGPSHPTYLAISIGGCHRQPSPDPPFPLELRCQPLDEFVFPKRPAGKRARLQRPHRR